MRFVANHFLLNIITFSYKAPLRNTSLVDHITHPCLTEKAIVKQAYKFSKHFNKFAFCREV